MLAQVVPPRLIAGDKDMFQAKLLGFGKHRPFGWHEDAFARAGNKTLNYDLRQVYMKVRCILGPLTYQCETGLVRVEPSNSQTMQYTV